MANKSKYYVTTPIYYVTAGPHIGSLYTTVIADAIARYNRLRGNDVFFLTGTDEHGQKVAQAAQQAGIDPKAFVDKVSEDYKRMWKLYDLDYTDFIRTTDERHKQGVYKWIENAEKKGDVYKARYEGWYCVPDETFVTEQAVEGKAPLCPTCGRETIAVSEENYFFRLSAYQDRLLKFYKENPDFITPKERLNEVISFVESGLKDLSISRTTVNWAIPFPRDPKHRVYVWVDALMNYATAVGYGNDAKAAEFNYWWPADLHIMAKEIVKFHAAYWPAFLMSADLPLPKRLLVHGWITVDGKKMSKSLGNVVDPVPLAEKYGVEPVKYYLLRQLPISQDGDFSYAGLEQHINADLVGGLGNLLNRVAALAEKQGLHTIEARATWSQESQELFNESCAALDEYQEHLKDYYFHMALSRLWKLVNQTNAYFHAQEPWKLAKSDPEKFKEVLSATCHSLRTIALLLWPVMPKTMQLLLESIGVQFDVTKGAWAGLDLWHWNYQFTLTKVPTLFNKIEQVKEQQVKKTEPSSVVQEGGPTINIDIVAQVELVVGTIEQAELVEKSDKLLKLHVDFGAKGKRTILAGIRKWYLPVDLIGKQAVFVYNLKPRALMGHESQGMLLVAEGAEGGHYISPAGLVPNGTRLK
jgi:methionyl-tRNA synthetase